MNAMNVCANHANWKRKPAEQSNEIVRETFFDIDHQSVSCTLRRGSHNTRIRIYECSELGMVTLEKCDEESSGLACGVGRFESSLDYTDYDTIGT